MKKFDSALSKVTLNLEELRGLAWNGIPSSKLGLILTLFSVSDLQVLTLAGSS